MVNITVIWKNNIMTIVVWAYRFEVYYDSKENFSSTVFLVEWCLFYSVHRKALRGRRGKFTFNDLIACSGAVNQIWQALRIYLTAVQPKPNEKHWWCCVCVCKNVFIFISYYPSKTPRALRRMVGDVVNNQEKQIQGTYLYVISAVFGWILYICDRWAAAFADSSKTILVDRAHALQIVPLVNHGSAAVRLKTYPSEHTFILFMCFCVSKYNPQSFFYRIRQYSIIIIIVIIIIHTVLSKY